MLNLNRKFLSLFQALTLVSSLGAPTLAMAGEKFTVSWSDAGKYIHNLGVEVSENRSSVNLVGFILKDCQQHIAISVRDSKNFQVTIDEDLDACLKQNKDSERFSSSNPRQLLRDYARVSDLGGATLSVADRDVEVGFIYRDELKGKDVRESIGEGLKFTSERTRLEKEKAERLEKLTEKANCVECRDTESGQKEVLAAIRALVKEGELTESQAEELRKPIYDKELELIKEAMKKANASDLEALDARLSKWAKLNKANKDAVEEASKLRMDIAMRIVKADPSSVRNNESALAIFEELSESGNLSDKTKQRAQSAVFDMRGNLVAAQLNSMLMAELAAGTDPMQIHTRLMQSAEYEAYSNYMKEQMESACGSFQQSFTQGGRESMERCSRIRSGLAQQQARIQDTVQKRLVEAHQKAAALRQQQAQSQQQLQLLSPNGVPYGQTNLFPSLGQ